MAQANFVCLFCGLLLKFQGTPPLVTFVPDKIPPIVRARRIALIRSCAPLFLLLALPGLAASQTAAPVGAAQQQAANSPNTSPAIDELQSRLQAAAAARD